MLLAGHYPTKRFSLEEVSAMPFFPRGTDDMAPEGSCWTLDDRGRALVGYSSYDADEVSYVVRPIVVVKVSANG